MEANNDTSPPLGSSGNDAALPISTMSDNCATVQQCANCAQPARHLCSRCAEGVDLHGQERKVYYCGKNCQAAHWAAGHKLGCKVAIDRRQLFRIGSLVQEAFYQSSKAVWHQGISKVKKIEHVARDSDPRLLVWRCDTQDSLEFPTFPDELIEEKRDQHAVLAGSISAVAIVTLLVGNLVKAANCHISMEEVSFTPTASRYVRSIQTDEMSSNSTSTCEIFRATLRNGQMFAIDPCNAQYNFTTAAEHCHGVFEWNLYVERVLGANRNAIDVQPLEFGAPPKTLYGTLADGQAGVFVEADIESTAEMRAFSNLLTLVASLEAPLGTDICKALGRALPPPGQPYDMTLKKLMHRSSTDREHKNDYAAFKERLQRMVRGTRSPGTRELLMERLSHEAGN